MKTLITILFTLFCILNANAQNISQTKKNIWKQYKKVPVKNINDTIPYSECYITIQGNKLIYKREGKEIYTDSIYVDKIDKKYKAKTFRFKVHISDVLLLTGENEEELLLKRFANEGDYEYFRKM